jgi:hypothetical protein
VVIKYTSSKTHVTPAPLPGHKLGEPVVGWAIRVVPGSHGGGEDEAYGTIALYFQISDIGNTNIDSRVRTDVSNSLGESAKVSERH